MSTTPAQARPRLLTARDLSLIAVFAAFLAALAIPGAFYLPWMSVPITAQTLGVILAGCVLGPVRATASVLVFLVLVAAGLPLLAGGRGGLGVFSGPTAGYLFGWALGALLTGLVLVSRSAAASRPIPLYWFFVAGLVGTAGIYLVGVPVMAAVLDVSIWKAFTLNFSFLPGDATKIVAAAIVAGGVHRGYPGLLGRGRSWGRGGTVVVPDSAAAVPDSSTHA
jgi:biotin transport system substrate-specific component